MKKVGKIVFLSLAALALAGCGQQQAKNKTIKSSSGKGAATVKPSKNNSHALPSHVQYGHLSYENLSPQKTVATVTAYAGKKYPDQWGAALNNAENNSLQVNLKDQSSYHYMNQGAGVAYMLTNDIGYSLKSNGDDNEIFLYANKQEIGQASLSQMTDYLNHLKDGEKLVDQLAADAQVNDERGTGSSSNSDHSDIAGDGGYFNMPSSMQGTWYSDDSDSNSKIVISAHSINQDGQSIELHKQNSSLPQKYLSDENSVPANYKSETKNWASTDWVNKELHGIRWINTRGWLQSAGDGEFYGLHNEAGQTVLVTASGAGFWTDAVYWRSPQLAHQYKNKKFKDLFYQDDD